MIVASLLLILVAVTLLVLGLAGGSSTLLISSIVTSLLAAVALVVGARHAAAQRRTGGPDGLPVDPAADLTTADLAAAGRTPAGRTPADLTAADLTAADLLAADRGAADLTDADRGTADLTDADRGTADLTDADRRAADRMAADRLAMDDTAADLLAEPVGAGTRGDRYPAAGAAGRPYPDRPDEQSPHAEAHASDGATSDSSGVAAEFADLSDHHRADRPDFGRPAGHDLEGAHAGPGGFDRYAEDAPAGSDRDVPDLPGTSASAGTARDRVGADRLVADERDDPYLGSTEMRTGGAANPASADVEHAGPADVAGPHGPRATSDFSGSGALTDDLVGSDHGSADARRDRVSGPGRAASDFSSSDDLRADSAAFPDHRGTDEAPDGHSADDRPADPDYDRAATVIGAARSTEPPTAPWDNDPLQDGETTGPLYPEHGQAGPRSDRGVDEADHLSPPSDPLGSGSPSDPLGSGSPSDPLGSAEDPLGAPARRGAPEPDYLGDLLGHGAAGAGGATASGPGYHTPEFDEPDDEDPADEPLPQAVRPGDAVRVAQLDAEVVVVDGRPRYHLADCGHLAGRLSEPLPVREAVELGFSPCGQCRPVDRLVARATRP